MVEGSRESTEVHVGVRESPRVWTRSGQGSRGTVRPGNRDSQPFSEPPQDLRSIFGDPGNVDVWVKEGRGLAEPRQTRFTMRR